MRVLHIVPALFGPRGIVGGAERYAYELARYMAEKVPTTLLTFGERGSEEQAGDLTIRVLGPAWKVRGQASNPMSWRLPREVLRADVIHCHQQHVLASSLSAAVARLSGRRVFATDLGGGGWDVSAYLNTDRWYHGHLHISQYSRKVLGHEGRPWAHVILGGVDTKKFVPDPAATREKRVLYVGRLLPHKGVDYLIEALPAGFDMDAIGQPYDPAYAADLKRLSDGKRVRFRHEVDDAALVAAYQRGLCVVLPSVYRARNGAETRVPELLGQTLLEAMACETPVICTDVASMPEVVVDGVTGFVVPPNDPVALREKLSWLREHPRDASEMGRAGRKRVLELFTWPAVVKRCLEIYGGGAPAT